MATLQKFKLLATQCGVAQSPTRSPRTSPVIHLRRRKTTLRMLLNFGGGGGRHSPRRRDSPPDLPRIKPNSMEKKGRKEIILGRTLKDLFVSSPPFEEGRGTLREKIRSKSEVIGSGVNGVGGGSDGEDGLRGRPESPRPVWGGFRQRSLLRRSWRPMLGTISEDDF